MGLRSLFGKRQAATGDTAAVAEPQAQEPLTPAQLAELQEAWAELAEEVKGSGVNSLHACSRGGKPWQEDPAAVRSMAAVLRRFQDEEQQPTPSRPGR